MPRMGPKDYRAIGQAIRNARMGSKVTGYTPDHLVAEYLADVFERDNPRFDRERFLRFVETGKDTRHRAKPTEFVVPTKRLSDKGKQIEAKVKAAQDALRE